MPTPFPVILIDSCTTTQEEARNREGELVVVAREQTAGRGRSGRSFLSPIGGLYLTVRLQRKLRLQNLGRLPLIAASLLADAARSLGAETRFKWPNDLVVDQMRKVAGILVEVDTDAQGQVDCARLGIGVNIGRAPPELPEIASFLDVEREALLEALLTRLPNALLALEDEHAWQGTLDALRVKSATLGQKVSIDGVFGIARALDHEGALLVDTDAGQRRFVAGDVHLV